MIPSQKEVVRLSSGNKYVNISHITSQLPVTTATVGSGDSSLYPVSGPSYLQNADTLYDQSITS